MLTGWYISSSRSWWSPLSLTVTNILVNVWNPLIFQIFSFLPWSRRFATKHNTRSPGNLGSWESCNHTKLQTLLFCSICQLAKRGSILTPRIVMATAKQSSFCIDDRNYQDIGCNEYKTDYLLGLKIIVH